MVKLGTRKEWMARPVDLIGEKDCPLCDEGKDKEYTLWEGIHWYIKLNKYPYTSDEFHIMAMPKIHKEFSSDLTKDEFTELFDVHAFISEYFDGKEYFSFTRETFGNRSIKHLHMHFIKGELSPGIIIESLKLQQAGNK